MEDKAEVFVCIYEGRWERERKREKKRHGGGLSNTLLIKVKDMFYSWSKQQQKQQGQGCKELASLLPREKAVHSLRSGRRTLPITVRSIPSKCICTYSHHISITQISTWMTGCTKNNFFYSLNGLRASKAFYGDILGDRMCDRKMFFWFLTTRLNTCMSTQSFIYRTVNI